MSKYEEHIASILRKDKIDYVREKSFQDLKKGSFRFDFYLPNLFGATAIVEVDGEQHFKFIPKFYKSRLDYMKAREHDRQKNSYCLANDILLYRIPYWEISNIKSIQDIISPRFLVKDRWFNDNIRVPK